MTKQEEIRIIKGTEHPEEFNPVARKQEEIREGIAQRAAWYFRGEDKIQPEDYEFADGIIGYEDSQGVVIEVKREFPVECSSKTHSLEYLRGYNHAKGAAYQAGYVAVEPLIKEG